MSLPINLLITTLLIYVVGAFISLAVRRNEQLSINISGVTGVLAGVLGIIACIPVLISSDTVVDVFKTHLNLPRSPSVLTDWQRLWCASFLY